MEFESRVSSLNLTLRFHGKEGLPGRVSSMGEGFKWEFRASAWIQTSVRVSN